MHFKTWSPTTTCGSRLTAERTNKRLQPTLRPTPAPAPTLIFVRIPIRSGAGGARIMVGWHTKPNHRTKRLGSRTFRMFFCLNARPPVHTLQDMPRARRFGIRCILLADRQPLHATAHLRVAGVRTAIFSFWKGCPRTTGTHTKGARTRFCRYLKALPGTPYARQSSICLW